jgi:hypothetical protein
MSVSLRLWVGRLASIKYGLFPATIRWWTLSAAVLVSLLAATTVTGQDVLTYHNDNARTGQDLNEAQLTPANVNPATFGKLFVLSVDGKVDAQPLYKSALAIPGSGTHNVLFVATENDSVYAFDADSGTPLWHVSVLGSGESPSDDRGCSQVTPVIGITATPVIDPTRGPHGILFLVAMSKDSSGKYYQRLHALDLSTGHEESGSPVTVEATYPGSGDEGSNGRLAFDAKQHEERAGLLLLSGIVYTSWTSHCDIEPYTGWIIGYNEATLQQTAVLNLAPNGIEASVWMGGAGLAADPAGSIYLLAANGTFDTALNGQGFPSQGDYGNAFLKLLAASNSLSVADYFDMSNTVSESAADQDLGSGGALLLPDLTDAKGAVHHLAAGAGKDQIIYIVDRDNMGKFDASTDHIYQELKGVLSGPVFGMPAWFNNTIYYGAMGAPIILLSVVNAQVSSTAASETSTSFEYPGATPAISANGASNAIVWATENTAPAILHAYDASNLSHELYNSNMAAGGRDQFGNGNKFITPTIANGKVYVGTTNGVGAFGPLAPAVSLSPPNLNFASEVVGQASSAQTVTLSNTGPATLTITSISANGDFAETNNCGSSVNAGASCAIQVTFKASAGGNRSGTLTVMDSAPGSPQTVTLSGAGEDFSIAAASGSSTSATIAAGQTARYIISLLPVGEFNQQLSLACSGAPKESTCSVSPSSAVLNGASPAQVTVTVGTTAPSSLLPLAHPFSRLHHTSLPVVTLAGTLLAMLLVNVMRGRLRSAARVIGFLLAVSAAALMASCGGASGNSSASDSLGTPQGSYSLTITATYGMENTSLQRELALTLTVD